jgi:NIMA (never in mitosis gene a)-related kinase
MEKKKPENYKRVKQLGQGNFGVAYLVQCKHQKTEAVMKRVDIAMMSEDEKKNCVKEAKILEKMNHPNIIRFREVFKTKSGKLCIVMDYADGGDLANRIKEQRKLMNSTGKDQYFSED